MCVLIRLLTTWSGVILILIVKWHKFFMCTSKWHLSKNKVMNPPPVTIISYDEKPGIQAISGTSPDLPPVPGKYLCFSRDYEYKRHGTVSFLAGIDLLDGRVHGMVIDRHRSREFIEYHQLVDTTYPKDITIRIILDNYYAYIKYPASNFLS